MQEQKEANRSRRDRSFQYKAQVVGIPRECGIFVSTSRYTEGAQTAAREDGIKLLVLEGLNEQKSAEAIFQAIQSSIHLSAEIEEFGVASDARDASVLDLITVYAEDSARSVSVPDVLHRVWMSNQILVAAVGRYRVRMTPTVSMFHKSGEERFKVWHIDTTLRISALVFDCTGSSKRVSLIDHISRNPERTRIGVKFDSESALSLKVCASEQL